MSDDHLTDLYQEIILDHNRHPKNKYVMKDPTHVADGFNPLCGDEIFIYVKAPNETIEEISFSGQGCAISQASASLLIASLKGKSLTEAINIFTEVNTILTSEDDPDCDLAKVGDLAALAGVRKFPARIKCATLAWHTYNNAINHKKSASTESGSSA